ncbi:MAG: DUF2723 domain-containing protein [Flavobacteriales bacterium]|nr:DUF2723 domain-containing protein [Flavobacteriales bacterium]MBP9079743.1 DUF2723 domain-containing protein [Flavobacteriales bacterium]
MNFNKLNVLTGWAVFLVAAYTYLATIEPTASFWDCGEFIATAYNLEVGHPPGAPLFMILARVASAFVSVENVPVAVNVLSALASAFTILFLFWSITHMAWYLAVRKGDEELTSGKVVAVLGSGIVGALAYAWSDSFWFSAVEGEVYALSSFFTAIVFWAILKWEREADKPHNTRWLILIAYLMGLSIGVHLLNLLCIPAIAFVYYFKKYQVTRKGIIYTFIISALILGAIQAVIIPGLVKMAGSFELLFVNDFGLPFNTGTLIYTTLILGLVAWGLVWTQRHGKVVLNTVLLGVTVILAGYSTYAMIVVRSNANPPIDENNPENVFNLLSYLNREQYGDRPLMMGQFWGSQLANQREDGNPVYTATWKVMKGNRTAKVFYDGWSADHFLAENPGHTLENEYVVTDARKGTEPVYDPATTMLFPRMYSSQSNHIDAYKQWSDFKGVAVRTTDREGKPTVIQKPTQLENLRFFTDYQVNWMYWRYFLWNFAGRQNDIQGHGGITDGNWYTGIKAIDAQRLGNQDTLPPSMTRNKGMNKLFLLPMLLGLIGLVYQLSRDVRNGSVVLLLFFFTGLAIVIYLNQYPFQPRERDYAYVGSFYAFAIWIGLGVYALFDAARSVTRRELMVAVGGTLAIGVLKFLAEMLAGGDHAISYSLFYMGMAGGLALGAMHLLGRLRNDRSSALAATLIGLVVPVVMVRAEWDDHDRSNRYPARDLAADYLNSCAPNAILFTNGDNDTFPLWYAQEVEGIRTDVRVVNLSLLNTDWYIDQMRRKAYASEPVPFTMDPAKYRQGTRDVVALIPNEKIPGYLDLKRAMGFATDDRNLQQIFQLGKKDAYIPAQRFRIPADSAFVFGPQGMLTAKDTALFTGDVRWTVNRQYVMKNHFLMMDLLANNDWKRPIYFAVTTGPDSYLNLQDHFRLEGLTYRLVPVAGKSSTANTYGSVATDIMLDNVVNKFKWGGMDHGPGVYLDENVLRMTTNLRLQIATLATELAAEGRKEEAKQVLDLAQAKMPEHNVPYDRIMLPIIEAYYQAGDTASANRLGERLFTIMDENMAWYLSLSPEFAQRVEDDMGLSKLVMDRLARTAQVHGQQPLATKLLLRSAEVDTLYQMKLEDMATQGRRTINARF